LAVVRNRFPIETSGFSSRGETRVQGEREILGILGIKKKVAKKIRFKALK